MKQQKKKQRRKRSNAWQREEAINMSWYEPTTCQFHREMCYGKIAYRIQFPKKKASLNLCETHAKLMGISERFRI